LNKQPDTIFEIGGQDSKYISIENGVVVDFAMNEACAAGTGSFLEERADELDISIKGEFARLALSSDSPLKLGERCTVFMQQDVAAQQQKGASKEDITAGLAYSIVLNYLNRVVGRRKIGDVIFFQGGTAYNDAIASAFSRVLDKEIIVPPYNGVVGAVGAALLAREKMDNTAITSKFRGFNLENIDYTLKEFTCKACSNFCHMQEFTVEEEKTYWGDQCSDKFRRRQITDKKPVIDDLLNYKRTLFFKDEGLRDSAKATIGLPRGMYVYEHFPLWRKFFNDLGYSILLSGESNGRTVRTGGELSVAEPCLPIQVYHGHVEALAARSPDWIFVPNMINAQTMFRNVNSYYCPWGQTLPYVLKNASGLESVQDKIIHPSLRFRDGFDAIAKALYKSLAVLGETKKSIRLALESAFTEMELIQTKLFEAGKESLKILEDQAAIGIVLVGRTYNLYDRGMTLDIGNKLRDYYGINVIPMDFLPLTEIDISDVNQNMYWNYGRNIIAAARFIEKKNNLHLIYLTNFKCGPDSYIKHYITEASGKPFLILQFDGHSNDAGYITRCEAYLDSKGAI
jgi:predicted nucleotide-binding protein (sugar kinase/HSP70/actin superfamily)